MIKVIFFFVFFFALSNGKDCYEPWRPCENIQYVADKCDLVKVKDLVSKGYDHTFLYASSGWFVEVNSYPELFKKNEGYKRRGVVSQAYGGECCRIVNNDYSHLIERSKEDCTQRFRKCIENDNMNRVPVFYSISTNNCEHYATRWKYYTEGESKSFEGFWARVFKGAADLAKFRENDLPKDC